MCEIALLGISLGGQPFISVVHIHSTYTIYKLLLGAARHLVEVVSLGCCCVLHSGAIYRPQTPRFADIDECISDPCQNGGTCIDAANGFRCNCAPGYTGPSCQSGKTPYDINSHMI